LAPWKKVDLATLAVGLLS